MPKGNRHGSLNCGPEDSSLQSEDVRRTGFSLPFFIETVLPSASYQTREAGDPDGYENHVCLRLLLSRSGQIIWAGLASISMAPAVTSSSCRTTTATSVKFAGARCRP